MSDCWQVLGLDGESDVRTVKRRYAQLLKVTRPDDDPLAFQQLRSAYEQALSYVQAPAPVQVQAVPLAVPTQESAPAQQAHDVTFEPAALVEPSILARTDNPAAWLDEVFRAPTLAQLPELLSAARERDCQALFELRLLDHCLQHATVGVEMAEWATEHLHWLTPWQSAALPAERTEQLAVFMLYGHINAVAQALAQGYVDVALQRLQELLRRSWLESLERREWARQALIQWAVDEPNRTPYFVEQFSQCLGLDDDDVYADPDNAALQQLRTYRKDLQLLAKVRQHLAVAYPKRVDEQAAWMLLKELPPANLRWLADSMNDDGWLACEALGAQLRDRYPHLVPQLCRGGVRDWRVWRVRPASKWTYLLVLLASVIALLLPTLVESVKAGEVSAYTQRIWAGRAMVGAMFALVVCWASHQLSGWLSLLAKQDIWLSSRILPAALSRNGAGLLLIRHGVPCLLFGAMCAGWANSLGLWAAVLGGVVSVVGMFHVNGNLRGKPWAKRSMAEHLSQLYERRQRIVSWVFLTALAAWFVVMIGNARGGF